MPRDAVPKRQDGRALALSAFFAVLLATLLLSMIFVEAARGRASLRRVSAREDIFTDTVRCTGYLFRDEEILTTVNDGPVAYLCADGAAVAKDDTVAEVYGDSEGGKREKAAALYAKIEALESALADPTGWQAGYRLSYASLLSSDLADDADRQTLAAALATGSLNDADARAAARAYVDDLRAQITALVRFEGEPMPVRAPAAGTFFREIDGWEAFFGTAAATALTPESFAALLAGENVLPGAVGKLICSDVFYLVVPLAANECDTFTVGSSYPVRIGQESVALLLDRVALSENGADALLVFRGTDAAKTGSARRVNVSVERRTLSGIVVPESAICAKDGKEGVFIDQAGKAAFREIDVLYRENGVCLVFPDDREGYLATGDTIVFGNRRLNEGKVVSE